MSILPSASVIDASFGIKLVIEEDHSSRVREYLERLLDDPPSLVYVPDLFFTECANILWKLVSRGMISPGVAEHNCQALLKLMLPVTSGTELMARAVELGVAYGISAYDASYLALAEKLHLPLLTADNRLAAAMASSPYQVIALDNLFAPS